MMYRPTDTTLYVPAFQAEATLPACLEAIHCQTCAPAKILVIDDGSSNPVQADAAEIIRHNSNLGLAATRNTAIAACGTALLAALDADVTPAPDWLEHLLEAINSGPFAGAGGRLDEHFQETTADKWRAVHMAQHWGNEPVRNPKFLFGANTIFQTNALRAAGNYNPLLRTNNEDRAICDALRDAGRELIYTPLARAKHLRRDSAFSILRGYWKWHHAKGLLRGDFDSFPEILNRIANVNFGIFSFRFNLDLQSGRHFLLPLDAILPWIFSKLDLDLFTQRAAAPAIPFPKPHMLANLPEQVASALSAIIGQHASYKSLNDNLEKDYSASFAAAFAQVRWLELALDPIVPWVDFLKELNNERCLA